MSLFDAQSQIPEIGHGARRMAEALSECSLFYAISLYRKDGTADSYVHIGQTACEKLAVGAFVLFPRRCAVSPWTGNSTYLVTSYSWANRRQEILPETYASGRTPANRSRPKPRLLSRTLLNRCFCDSTRLLSDKKHWTDSARLFEQSAVVDRTH